MVFFAMTENDGGRLSRAARLAGSVTETMRPYCNRPTHKKQRIVAGLKMPNQGCLWNIRFRLRGCLSREGKISNSRDAFKGTPGGCPDLQIRTLMVKKARMALQENQIKPLQLDYATIREMLPTATRDRVLRFIGQQHPGDIAVLFKGLEPPEVRQLFEIFFSTRRASKTLKALPPELIKGLLFGSV